MANLAQIRKYLKSKKISYKIIDLGDEIYTVEGVAESGVDEEQIVKTLIIRFEPNSSPGLGQGYTALAVRGKDRVDFKKVRKLFGNKSELAKPEEVLKVCGVPVGAVCPILLDMPVYFDERVMDLKHVNMGSGDLTKGLEMDLSDLLAAVDNYQVEDLIKISTQIKL